MKSRLIIKYLPRETPVEQTWPIARIVEEFPPRGWEEVFTVAHEELKGVSEVVEEEERQNGRCLPLRKHIFNAFELLSLRRVKMVLFGQDPYHTVTGTGKPIAKGLSFSVGKNDAIPPSLRVMYEELAECYPDTFRTPVHGCLTRWADQGVLLLNSSLTVQKGAPGSHGIIWHGFLQRVLNALAEHRPNTVYILLGAKAQALKSLIDNRATIVEAAHPSPLNTKGGFRKSRVFVKANDELIKKGIEPVDWNVDSPDI